MPTGRMFRSAHLRVISQPIALADGQQTNAGTELGRSYKVHFLYISFSEFRSPGSSLEDRLCKRQQSTGPSSAAGGFGDLDQDILDIAMAEGLVYVCCLYKR